MSTYSVLAIDEDIDSWSQIQEALAERGFNFSFADSIDAGFETLKYSRIDLVLLDEAISGADFLDVLREIKQRYTLPLFVISNKANPPSKVTSLELGADDYIHKPIDIDELAARVKSQLKLIAEVRQQALGDVRESDTQAIRFRRWILDFDRYELREAEVDGAIIGLTSGELEILMALARSAGKVLTREQLFAETRGRESETFDRAVDVQISRIRQKLNSGEEDCIRTVRGVGYMLDADIEKIPRKPE
jgi:two-component system OmpR family response regulator